MKAKEYYEKYSRNLVNTDEKVVNNALYNLIIELSSEVEPLAKIRHAKSNRAVAAIVSELNQKYNAIGTLFIKEFGASPLKRDGFKEFWKKKIPELFPEKK